MADIHELFRQVRDHPDFVFGTIFTLGDCGGTLPEGFDAKAGRVGEEIIAQRGNEYLENQWGVALEEDEDDEDSRPVGALT